MVQKRSFLWTWNACGASAKDEEKEDTEQNEPEHREQRQKEAAGSREVPNSR